MENVYVAWSRFAPPDPATRLDGCAYMARCGTSVVLRVLLEELVGQSCDRETRSIMILRQANWKYEKKLGNADV